MFFEMRFDLGTLDSGERSLLFVLLVLFCFQQFLVISRRCLVGTGSSSAHFYSATSLKYHALNT